MTGETGQPIEDGRASISDSLENGNVPSAVIHNVAPQKVRASS
jgi:hypothetical protein